MERVLWPMEPVEPRMVSRFKLSLLSSNFCGSQDILWFLENSAVPNGTRARNPFDSEGWGSPRQPQNSGKPSKPLVNKLSVPQHRSGQQQGVYAVEDPAVAGHQDP